MTLTPKQKRELFAAAEPLINHLRKNYGGIFDAHVSAGTVSLFEWAGGASLGDYSDMEPGTTEKEDER